MSTIVLTAFGLAAACLVIWRFVASVRKSETERMLHRDALTQSMADALSDLVMMPEQTAGVMCFQGRRSGLLIRVQTIADTLALRKLPSWWLSVTVQAPVDIDGTIDVVMRPDMPASFSNFHKRPHAIDLPRGMPEHAAIRSDLAGIGPFAGIIAGFAPILADRRMKEMLIAPNGVRLVWLMAEADRVRYGVFRQAHFGDKVPSAELIARIADQAIDLHQAVQMRRKAAA